MRQGAAKRAREQGCVCDWIEGFGVGEDPAVWEEMILLAWHDCPTYPNCGADKNHWSAWQEDGQ